MIRLIGLDADDTLWHNEIVYREAKVALGRILARFADPPQTHEHLNRNEVRNVEVYGYGIKSFTFSMLETAAELSRGGLTSADIEAILGLGRAMLLREVEPIAHVGETLAALAPTMPLALLTKGDLAEQTRKINRSGWASLFRHVHVVADKTLTVYRDFLAQANVSPADFLMVGNSLRSDILPVLELGGHAAYIPHPLTWDHESAAMPSTENGRFHLLTDIRDVLPLVAGLTSRGP
ncbi:MAG: HAD family hydrolase [Chloroflexi bacterium]|jgi:putative hydrolase of the HAD superfamily|nr:HAD family hydrolase [Chloroflexota bacterium]